MPHCLRHFQCVSVSPIIKSFPECFFVHLLIPVCGQIGTIQSSRDEFFLEKVLFPSNSSCETYRYWPTPDPQMGPICFAWYSQSNCWKVLKPAWSILGIRSHGPKILDIAPKCGIKPLLLYVDLFYAHRLSEFMTWISSNILVRCDYSPYRNFNGFKN